METRKAKLIATKGGSGSSTFRATLPAKWVREMGLSEDLRNIKLEFDGKEIIIKNNEEEMKMMEKLLERAKIEIEKEMSRVGYIDDSDNCDRFLDELARELVEKELVPNEDDLDLYYEKEGDIEELAEGLLEDLRDYTGKYNLVKVESRLGYGYGNYCYTRGYEGLINWYNEISDDSYEDMYEKLKNKLSETLSKKDFCKILDIEEI